VSRNNYLLFMWMIFFVCRISR